MPDIQPTFPRRGLLFISAAMFCTPCSVPRRWGETHNCLPWCILGFRTQPMINTYNSPRCVLRSPWSRFRAVLNNVQHWNSTEWLHALESSLYPVCPEDEVSPCHPCECRQRASFQVAPFLLLWCNPWLGDYQWSYTVGETGTTVRENDPRVSANTSNNEAEWGAPGYERHQGSNRSSTRVRETRMCDYNCPVFFLGVADAIVILHSWHAIQIAKCSTQPF